MTPVTPRASIETRPARKSDGPTLWRLATSGGLDENSPYAYVLFCEYFSETTFVATDPEQDDDVPVGFLMGFRPPRDPETVFVWQVGVDEDHRQRGIAGRLLDSFVDENGAAYLEATVTPDNTASDALFRRFADRRGAEVVTDEVFPSSLFPAGHGAEIRYRIGPLAH